MSRRRARRDRDGGYILVAVLGVMVILTGFLAAGSMVVRSALDTVRVGDADTASLGLTRAGLELAAYQLFVVKAAPDAVDGRRLRFAGGTIATRVVDEAGKADLNESDSKLLTSVFRTAGMDDGAARALMACVVDLRGPDRNTEDAAQPPQQPQQGAPDSVTQPPSNTTTQKPRPRGFQSVDQLRECPDLTVEDYSAVAPLVTVYNLDGKINVLTASEEVLRAMPGVSEADVEVLLARRGGADAKAADDLMSLMKEAKAYGKTVPGPIFSLRVDATAATGRKKTIHAVVAPSKSPSAPYYVLDFWDQAG
ncbi:MAG: general secretion pathway protein GspK [Caulobacteraceae bacterium]|nr:general secretion pathway protein GspK [Caulobacter sp.]